MLKEFRQFILRGNVVDLAVAVVIGTAFGAVVAAFVADIITPLIAAIFGKPDFAALSFTINHSTFLYGDFLNAIITFVSIAAAIFFFVVKPLNMLEARRAAGQPVESPTTKACPECLSDIPVAARRCAYCTSEVAAAA
ncbi:MAG TPA: large conductance mechanosensitive channel protein MscL [Gaiellales bacterium]|nr:large conductance mechanosensitive channel protein MscL [Gaiellales bacterium]